MTGVTFARTDGVCPCGTRATLYRAPGSDVDACGPCTIDLQLARTRVYIVPRILSPSTPTR